MSVRVHPARHAPNPSGMKRLPDESGQPVPVEDPASMKPVN
ncbi:MAG: hypothetical protein ACLRRU_10050 [Faecalibacterium sp.]